jgi:type III pantothenate kinase
MLLAVDAGNTRIKWGLHDGKGWRRTASAPTADVGQLAQVWTALAARPERVIVSNVAGPAVGAALAQSVAILGASVVPFAPRAEQAGVVNRYDMPHQLGTDRWAALIAARNRVKGACIVVHVGTTMVVDALTESGEFLGGLLVPGIDLMVESLARRIESLRVPPGRYEAFPRNTPDALASGAVDAAAGAVAAMVRRLGTRSAAAPAIIVAGGAAARLLPHLQGEVQQAEHLVLDGLAIAGLA